MPGLGQAAQVLTRQPHLGLLGTQTARFLSRSPGTGMMLGAGVGAAAGGLKTPQEGQSRLGNAFWGGVGGATVGGGAGSFARNFRDAKLLAAADGGKTLTNMQAAGGALRRMGGGISNFTKRQIHGVTGAFDHDAIGMAGNATSARKVKLLNLREADELAHAPAARHDAIKADFKGQVDAELKAGRGAQELADAGLTTAPGLVRALAKGETRGRAVKAMGKAMLYGPGGWKATVAAPLALSVPGLLKGDETATGGQSMGQKVVGLGTMLGTGAVFGGMPIIPQMVAGEAVTRGANRLVRPRPSQQPVAPQQPVPQVAT